MLAITFLFVLIFISIVCIRKNKFIRNRLRDKLYYIGIQIGNNIYTPVCDIHTEFKYFDMIVMVKEKNNIHGYRIFNREYFNISLKYIPVGHHLVYKHNNKNKEHLYLEGTPFKINKGELILYVLDTKYVIKMGIMEY